MDIHEIILLFGQYLHRQELLSGICVSKAWHEVLSPFIYHRIPSHEYPSLEALERYAHHIRELDLSITEDTDQETSTLINLTNHRSVLCQNLKRLKLTFEGHEDDDTEGEGRDWWRTVPLVFKNSYLISLSLVGKETRVNVFAWGSVFAHCPKTLQELSLVNISLSGTDMKQVFELGPQLLELTILLCEVWSDPSKDFIHSPQFPALTHFSYDHFYQKDNILDWLIHCPRLVSLNWQFPHLGKDVVTPTVEAFGQFLRTQYWSQLHSISFNGVVNLTDGQCALILNSCASLTKVCFDQCPIWYRSFHALEKRHFQTLEHLDIIECTDIHGWMIQRILTSCPRLKFFQASWLKTNEIVTGLGAEESRAEHALKDTQVDVDRMVQEDEFIDPKILDFYSARDTAQVPVPWVCLEIEELQVAMELVDDGGWDEQIFAQLAKLTKLKFLNVGYQRFPIALIKTRGLAIRLQSGLAQLATLKNLQSLIFNGTSQEMEEEDLRWIKSQWPDLWHLTCNFHEDPDRNQELRRVYAGCL